MRRLSTKIYTSPFYKSRDEINLVVEFVNETAQPVFVSRNIADSFTIGNDKKILKPKANNKQKTKPLGFFTVPANSSIIKKINLGKKPGLNPGIHELLFLPKGILVHQGKSPKSKAKNPPLKLKSLRSHILIKDKKSSVSALLGKKLKAKGLPESSSISTLRQPEIADAEVSARFAPPRICRVIGGDRQMQDTIRAAHEDGYNLAAGALANLRNDAHYRRWFGILSGENFRRVRDALLHIVDNLRHETFTYDLTGNNCRDDIIAHTEFPSRTITVCRRFWNLPPTGRGSMAGRIVHEHSHASADTLDSAFSTDACLELAIDSPAQAVENASNYQFFAEG